MENHVWAKTLLSSYRFLDRIAGAIDKIIEKKALSQNMHGGDMLGQSTLSLAEKIIGLSERKVKLINIKILTEQALKKMDPFFANLLIKKYIDQCPTEKIIESLSLPRRTYFRKIAEAESAFEGQCALLKFPNKKLEEYLSTENWIMQVKASFDKGEPHLVKVKMS